LDCSLSTASAWSPEKCSFYHIDSIPFCRPQTFTAGKVVAGLIFHADLVFLTVSTLFLKVWAVEDRWRFHLLAYIFPFILWRK